MKKVGDQGRPTFSHQVKDFVLFPLLLPLPPPPLYFYGRPKRRKPPKTGGEVQARGPHRRDKAEPRGRSPALGEQDGEQASALQPGPYGPQGLDCAPGSLFCVCRSGVCKQACRRLYSPPYRVFLPREEGGGGGGWSLVGGFCVRAHLVEEGRWGGVGSSAHDDVCRVFTRSILCHPAFLPLLPGRDILCHRR